MEVTFRNGKLVTMSQPLVKRVREMIFVEVVSGYWRVVAFCKVRLINGESGIVTVLDESPATRD